VENTGTVPMEVEVTFRWLYGDGTNEDASAKTVTVGVGGEKLVFFKHPATIDEIGSFQDHPDYFVSGNCKTDATILNEGWHGSE
jgi:hypothetical protein